MNNTPCVLIVRDGWGHNPHPEHNPFNAVHLARTPVADALDRDWPKTLIRTSGEAVGLLEGTMGNSEVGHQNIGAGRIVDQDAVRITKACRAGTLASVPALADNIAPARDSGAAVHLMGIASDAGVHGLLEHLFACLDLCRQLDQRRVFVHLFTDGRDTGPFTGTRFVAQVQQKLDESGVGVIASVIGRYFAMDRDNRWERVERAYACLTGRGPAAVETACAADPLVVIERHYGAPADPRRAGDEFVPPTMIGNTRDEALARRIADGDTVIYYNYRGDRPRELCAAFLDTDFPASVQPSPDTGVRGFDRGAPLTVRFVAMAPYSEKISTQAAIAFPKPPKLRAILGEHLSALGLTQFRCAETEKFPHVTFFFNDYRDPPFPGELREIIQSPRVATYDLAPEMSAAGVRDAVLARLRADDCEPVLIVNFANADMVGHTGKLDAAVKAVETVDACTGDIINATLARGGSLIVTADHGNAEQMLDPESNQPHTAHTLYDVPLYIVGEHFRNAALRSGGVLGDIAPTLLHMIGVDQPADMTGTSLITP